MDKVKRYFDGLLDADSADFAVAENCYINNENFRFGPNGGGKFRRLEAIESNIIQRNTYIPVTTATSKNMTLGYVLDYDKGRIIQFNWNSLGDHGIYSYENGTWYKVILNAQVAGGLGFSENSLIHSTDTARGLIFWTDDLNEPKRLNIEAGIKLNHPAYVTNEAPYVAPVKYEIITVIRRPPNYPILVEKKEAATLTPPITLNTNQVKNNAFKFTYFYTFRDDEESTLGMHSIVSNYNFKVNTFDIIELKVPFAEEINQDVQKVTLVAMYQGGDPNGYIIRTWDKQNPADLAEINAHNAGTTALTFYYSNNEIGAALSAPYLVKPFDSVPLLTRTLKLASNRLFMGNNLMGYDTPLRTSLTGTVLQQSTGETGVNGYYQRLSFSVTQPVGHEEEPDIYTPYFIYFPTDIDPSHPAGFYDSPSPLSLDSTVPGPIIDINDYVYAGPNIDSLVPYVLDNSIYEFGYYLVSAAYFETLETWDLSANGNPQAVDITVLKTDSSRKLGIVFYDRFMRQCGVVKGLSGLITIPDRDYDFSSTYNYIIRWDLLNTNALVEIPVWAWFYSIVSTNDLVRSTFVQARASFIKYVTKDVDGIYEFTSDTYDVANYGVAVKIDLLAGMGMGYTFQAGDIIKIYTKLSTTFQKATLSVVDTYADWVIAENHDFGSLAGVNALYEIYTPRPQAAANFYYEQAQMFPVANPGTANRQYSTLQGYIAGDISLINRGSGLNKYITENMSPNDTYWKNWFTNSGRVQVTDIPGQARVRTGRRWSNAYIESANNNGLSSFDSADQDTLPSQVGQIQRIMLTSKVANELGAVMVVVCERETVSTYLGEVQIVGGGGNAYLASSASVIGTNNILKGRFGTIHPESVVEFKGNVFFVDVYNGKVVQYGQNGLYPVSDYQCSRYWKLFGEQFMDMTDADFADIGSKRFIIGGIDEYNKEYLVSVPQLLEIPPNGDLFDYEFGIDYPYDIWDGARKTMVYKISDDRWQGAYRYAAAAFACFNNVLYSFDGGNLFSHNDYTTACRFYGVQTKARLMYAENHTNVSQVKVFRNIAVESLRAPDFTHFRTEKPWIQSSDLNISDYKNIEGIWYASILRDRLSPSFQANTPQRYLDALMHGDELRSDTLLVMLEYDCILLGNEDEVTQKLPWIKMVNTGYVNSRGHRI